MKTQKFYQKSQSDAALTGQNSSKPLADEVFDLVTKALTQVKSWNAPYSIPNKDFINDQASFFARGQSKNRHPLDLAAESSLKAFEASIPIKLDSNADFMNEFVREAFGSNAKANHSWAEVYSLVNDAFLWYCPSGEAVVRKTCTDPINEYVSKHYGSGRFLTEPEYSLGDWKILLDKASAQKVTEDESITREGDPKDESSKEPSLKQSVSAVQTSKVAAKKPETKVEKAKPAEEVRRVVIAPRNYTEMMGEKRRAVVSQLLGIPPLKLNLSGKLDVKPSLLEIITKGLGIKWVESAEKELKERTKTIRRVKINEDENT